MKTNMTKVKMLGEKPQKKGIKYIEVIGYIDINGNLKKSIDDYNPSEFKEIKVQKLNKASRKYDCILICEKINGNIAIYLGNFNDGII